LFGCAWTSSLWNYVRSWLRINRIMSALTSAIRGVKNKGKGLESHMRRVALALLMYLIWEERNKRLFDSPSKPVGVIFCRFQVLFYTIMYFHEKNPLAYNIAE